MPCNFVENVQFSGSLEPINVCLSTYQIQLNMVYQITSPVLEIIHETRDTKIQQRRSNLELLATSVNQGLQKWQGDLPTHLKFVELGDIPEGASVEEKMHKLQALALQLTHDNLVIIVNRPLLADRREQTTPLGTEFSNTSNNNQGLQRKKGVENLAFKRCLDAALSISNVVSKSRLMHLAQRTHLISFLGINLFTASVVMFICALSDVLSNTSQEAKRGIARALRLQKTLSQNASLSMQCSAISEDLIQRVLDKEREEILQTPPHSVDAGKSHVQQRHSFISPGLPESDPLFEFFDPTWTANANGVFCLEDDQLRQSLISLHSGTLCHLFEHLT